MADETAGSETQTNDPNTEMAARLAALEAKEAARIDAKLDALPEETRTRLSAIKDKLGLPVEAFGELVEEAADLFSPKGQNSSVPVLVPGGRSRVPAGERKLSPKTEKVLGDINADSRVARSLTEIRQEDGTRIISMPAQVLINVMRQRAEMHQAQQQGYVQGGKLLEEGKVRLLESAKRRR